MTAKTGQDIPAGEILEHIKSSQSIIITSHVEPDGDAFGSAYGLAALIREIFPDKSIAVSLERFNRGDLFPPSGPIEDRRFPESLVIVTDTANAERVYDSRWDMGKYVIKIDHHPGRVNFGNLKWVETSYPSCCEMIIDLMREWKTDISEIGAKQLFFGMITDTGRFRYPSVGAETFRRAAFLCEYYSDLPFLYNILYSEKEHNLRFRGYIFSNFKIIDKSLAYLKVDAAHLSAYGLDANQAGRMVNLLSELERIEIWAFFCEEKGGSIKTELRSNSIQVNTIAADFGGGGHRLAAGIKVKDWETADLVIEALRNAINEKK